ncbi:hypothetical protein ABZP36_001872 [Zizania latifolia]
MLLGSIWSFSPTRSTQKSRIPWRAELTRPQPSSCAYEQPQGLATLRRIAFAPLHQPLRATAPLGVAWWRQEAEICTSGEQRDEIEPLHADGIGGYILSKSSHLQIRQHAFSTDERLRSLILEAKSSMEPPTGQFPKLPSVLPPSPEQELPLHYWKNQFQSGGSYPESICLEEHLPSLSIPGDGIQRNYVNAGPNVIGYPHSTSKPRSSPCYFHFRKGHCTKGVTCRLSHEPRVSEGHNVSQVHPLGSLDTLEKNIRKLLFATSWPVSIDRLPLLYFEKYGKPLQPEGRLTDKQLQLHVKTGFSLTRLLMCLDKTRVIEREHGQYYIILVEDDRNYMDCLVHSCNLIDTGIGANKIYISFPPDSKFTEDDVQNYFKQYGPVLGVQIPCQEKCTFGFVSFLYTETVRLLLSNMTSHFICGRQVLVRRYNPELSRYSWKHCDVGAHTTSGVDAISEHHTGNNMKELSHVSDDLDEASASNTDTV